MSGQRHVTPVCDLVILNARVLTMDAHTPRATPAERPADKQLLRKGLDPVGLGPRAPAVCDGFDLCWRQLPGGHPGCIKGGPETPFLTASALKTHQRAL